MPCWTNCSRDVSSWEVREESVGGGEFDQDAHGDDGEFEWAKSIYAVKCGGLFQPSRRRLVISVVLPTPLGPWRIRG